jgi:hypothetical protein
MLGNEPVVVVNSAKAAHETFLSQGNAMSSRPMFYTFHKVLIRINCIDIRFFPLQPASQLEPRLPQNP